MPAWIDNQVAAYGGFAAVKCIGYSFGAAGIGQWYGIKRNAWAVGATRTLVGMIAGAAYFALFSNHLDKPGGGFPVEYYAGLFPVRLAEWWIIIYGFFDRKLLYPARGWGVAIVASIWSYVCDAPAVFGAFVTGGIGIC
jgi:hypothetical protein